jgi:hypothetical protein
VSVRLPVLPGTSAGASAAGLVPDVACTRCGACCVAPDIAALDKPLGRPCPHLGEDDLCTIYERRPEVCRAYQADALCAEIAAPTRAERVRRYLAHFGLEEEAVRVARDGETSMRAAREPRAPIC